MCEKNYVWIFFSHHVKEFFCCCDHHSSKNVIWSKTNTLVILPSSHEPPSVTARFRSLFCHRKQGIRNVFCGEVIWAVSERAMHHVHRPGISDKYIQLRGFHLVAKNFSLKFHYQVFVLRPFHFCRIRWGRSDGKVTLKHYKTASHYSFLWSHAQHHV